MEIRVITAQEIPLRGGTTGGFSKFWESPAGDEISKRLDWLAVQESGRTLEIELLSRELMELTGLPFDTSRDKVRIMRANIARSIKLVADKKYGKNVLEFAVRQPNIYITKV